MFRVILFLVLPALSNQTTFAQTPEPIQTDRPDQTESVAVTPKNYLQMEFGFSREQIDKENRSVSFPSLLLKYGLNERFEFRLITEWVSERSGTENLRGITPLALGFKVSICEEKGILPKTSFLGHLSIPKAASEKFQSKYFAPDFRFTMQHTLSDKISLGYNLGAEWNAETSEPAFIYTVTSGFSLTGKLGCYIELYGFAPQDDKADHRADGGFTYLVNNNFMIDLSGGVGITKNAPDHYFAVGFSHRFNTKRKISR